MPEGCFAAAPAQLPPGLGALTHWLPLPAAWSQPPSQDAAAFERHRPRQGQALPPPPPSAQYQPGVANGEVIRFKQMNRWVPPPPDNPDAYTWCEESWDWRCRLCDATATFKHVTGKTHKRKMSNYYHGAFNELDARGVPRGGPLQANVVPEGWDVPQGAVAELLWAYFQQTVTRDEAVPTEAPPPPPPPPTEAPPAGHALAGGEPAFLTFGNTPPTAPWGGTLAMANVAVAAPTLPRAARPLAATTPSMLALAAGPQDSSAPSSEAAAREAAEATNTGFTWWPDVRGTCPTCARMTMYGFCQACQPGPCEDPLLQRWAEQAKQAFEAMGQSEAADAPPPSRASSRHAGARPTASGGVPKAPPSGFQGNECATPPSGAVLSQRAPEAPSQPQVSSTMPAPTQAPAAAPTLEEQPLGTTGTGEAGPGGINGGTAAAPTPEERASSSAPAGEAAEASPAPSATDRQTLAPPLAPQATWSSTAVTPATPGEAPAAQEPRENKAG